MSRKLSASVPASSANLGPGFDTLGLALDFHLNVEAAPHSEWHFELLGEGAGVLDNCTENLIAKSYGRIALEQGWPDACMRCVSTNHIPISRGLGSSAAAIVAGMVLAQLENLGRIDRAMLYQAAAKMEGHPDNVAAAIFGGLQKAAVDRGRFTASPLPLHDSIRLLLVIPSRMTSTVDMRTVVPEKISDSAGEQTAQALDQVIAGLKEGLPAKLKYTEADRRHQPYRLAALPDSQTIFNYLSRHPDMAGAYLSGAGATVAGLVVGGADPVAEIRAEMLRSGIKADVKMVRPDKAGTAGAVHG